MHTNPQILVALFFAVWSKHTILCRGLCIDITHHTTNPGEISLSQLCNTNGAVLVAVAFIWHTNPQILVALVFAVLRALTMMSWVPVKLIGHTNPQILVAFFPRHVDNTQCCAGGLCINTAHQSKTPGDLHLRDAANTHDAVPGAWASM